MKIYIIERDNPYNRPEPQVIINGEEAIFIVKKEYSDQMKELKTSQEIADSGKGAYGCYWNFDDSFVGDCLIDSNYDSDRWEWRITEHII